MKHTPLFSISLLILLPLLITLLVSPVLADIGLVSPADHSTTTSNNITFDYYVGINNPSSCTLVISTSLFSSSFPDNQVVKGFNNFTLHDVADDSYTWFITCKNDTTTEYSVIRNLIVDTSPQPLYLNLTTDKKSYALGEPVQLTVDTVAGANVTIEVCPNEEGFVQCYTPIPSEVYPENMTLPYTNKTGSYIISGVAKKGNESVSTQTAYLVENTMHVKIEGPENPSINETLNLHASTTGAIGAVNYVWNLSNGSIAKGSDISVIYKGFGSFTESVTATDTNNNTASADYTISIDPEYEVTVIVKNPAGERIKDAAVQLEHNGESQTRITLSTGEAFFVMKPGVHKLFVSRDGYSYLLNDTDIEGDTTINVVLTPLDNQKPLINITKPKKGTTVNSPIEIHFLVEDASDTKCTLSFAKEGEKWMQEGGTLNVTTDTDQVFTIPSLVQGKYNYIIECEDASGNLGKSGEQSFSVSTTSGSSDSTTGSSESSSTGSTGESGDVSGFAQNDSQYSNLLMDGDDPLSSIDKAYKSYDLLSPEEQTLADLLGWESMIKESKKGIERALRDINSLQFRSDLSADEKKKKRADLEKKIVQFQQTLPVGIEILEKKRSVEYPSDEELSEVAERVATLKGYSKGYDKFLKKVQQSFTEQRTLLRATITYRSGKREPLSGVISEFRYKAGSEGSSSSVNSSSENNSGEDSSSGNSSQIVGFSSGGMSGSYTLYKNIPDAMASSADKVLSSEKYNALPGEPLALEFSPATKIFIYVKKDVSMETLASLKTVLLKKPSPEEINGFTGNTFVSSIFKRTKIDWKMSVILTLLIAVLIVVLNRLKILSHIRYLLYSESKKKPLHSIEVLINDGRVQLEAGNIEQAMMRYKEAKLSYEHLSPLAKNESYEDIIEFKRDLDMAYFELLINRIGILIERNSINEAIDEYARLEATFNLLPESEKDDLFDILLELGSRLGLTHEELSERSIKQQKQGGPPIFSSSVSVDSLSSSSKSPSSSHNTSFQTSYQTSSSTDSEKTFDGGSA